MWTVLASSPQFLAISGENDLSGVIDIHLTPWCLQNVLKVAFCWVSLVEDHSEHVKATLTTEGKPQMQVSGSAELGLKES